MTPEAERLVVDNIGYARKLAFRFNRKVPPMWRGDMESAALEGLMAAAENYDPAKGCEHATFVTYARWRINGHMGDELRKLHTGRRTETGNNSHDRTNDWSLDALAFNRGDELVPTDYRSDPAVIVTDDAQLRILAGLLGQLHWEDQELADMYFVQGLNMADIGRLVGLTESRICQKMQALKRRLRVLAARAELIAA